MVNPATAPHGRLAIRLGVSGDDEDVEFGCWPDPNICHGFAGAVRPGRAYLGVEDRAIEISKPLGIRGHRQPVAGLRR